MLSQLEKLGFSTEEAKVFLAVLEEGRCTAGPIVKRTGLHRQIVYDTLAKLKTRHLVSETVQSNRKNWTATSPSAILKEIQVKEALANEILPNLLSLQQRSEHRQEVRVFEGFEGFRAVHMENINAQPKDTIVPVIGATGWDWASAMEKARCLKKYEKLRIGRGVNHQLIFFKREKDNTQRLVEKYYADEPRESRREYRFLPEEFQSPVGMQVWHDNVTLVIYSDPVLIIQIKNDLVVKNFRKYFDILWLIGEE
jgi:HTH-type transcriptional regulator, sugar sensing transcriptional regulator